MSFIIHNPTEVLFNVDFLKELPNVLSRYGSKKVLLLTGKNFAVKFGYVDKIEKVFKENNLKYVTMSVVSSDPESSLVNSIVDAVKDEQIGVVVAFGGGSVIDAAKFVALLLNNGGLCEEYEFGEKIAKNALPIITIPTIPGSGSEVTPYTVIVNSNTRRKFTISSKFVVPSTCIIDVELSKELSKKDIIYSSLDCFIHALEGYISKDSNNYTKSIAKVVISLVYSNLLDRIKLNSSESRLNLAQASFMGGWIISNTRTGLIHTFSVAFSRFVAKEHGYLNSVICPYVLKSNLNYYEGLLANSLELIKGFKGHDDNEALLFIVDWLKSFELADNLSEYNFTQDNVKMIIDRVNQDKGIPNINIAPVSDIFFERIAKSIMFGEG